jgi:ZIP family zinc transporter
MNDPAAMNVVLLGTLGSLLAGLATGLGAAPALFIRRLSARVEDVLLSVAAGIMLAATFFSLLLPALTLAGERGQPPTLAAGVVILGVLSGAFALWAVHALVPHEHFVIGRQGPPTALRRIWLFVIAITLHNFPEGMAVGVGFGGGDIANGTALAIGIGLQNIPEGFAVAAALLSIDYPRQQAFGVAFLTGLLEPVGGVIGAGAVALAEPLLPWTLGFAAGSMLFVISDEIIPETHRRGHESAVTFALMGGFVVMMFLDSTLG